MTGGTETRWWRSGVGYEIYVRSFADSDGDGVGDLDGVTAHLDHLAWLGVQAVWLTPFYPTPDADHGYDVMDYCAVDPRFGDLDAFDRLVAEAHRLGLRVLVDVVPNHTSDRHPWFVSARGDRSSPTRDHYLWRDPAADGGPPNNWRSYFGGPAWTFDEATGQYYCHLFLPEQPDLNWRNPEVVAEFDRILQFWCGRGVDGFRIDVAHGLVKDATFRSNPQCRPVPPGATPREAFACFEHRYDIDQDDTTTLFDHWREVVAPFGAVLLGEVGIYRPERFARYVAGSGLQVAFALEIGWMPWDPPALLDVITGLASSAGAGVAWEVSNHDQPRAVTRFGGGAVGLRRTLALTTLLIALDGFPFLYQGEELGLDDGSVLEGAHADPVAVRNPDAPGDGRDGARTSMPWTAGPGNGFTTAAQAWLAAEERGAGDTVSAQVLDPDSPLHRYRALVGLRARFAELWSEPASVHRTGDVSLAVRRGPLLVLANLGDTVEVHELPPGTWWEVFDSATCPVDSSPHAATATIAVAAERTVVLVEQR